MKYKKTIIITGGLGFIGSNYLNKFVSLYPDRLFINLDCITYAAHQENVHVSKEKNYRFEKIDIRNISNLEKIFLKYKPTDIIHFAAESHVDISIQNPALFVETNIIGTHNLLLLAKKYKLDKFYQISTDEVYGSLGVKEPAFTTNSTIAPNSPYSASKASADMLVRSYTNTFGLNAVISRCSNNYGPNQDTTKLIPRFISLLLQKKKVPLYSKGENVRDWIYVEDHVDAINLVFEKGKKGTIHNIGGNQEMTNKKVTETLIKLAGLDESYIEYVPDRMGHDFRYAIDTTEIYRKLGWKPKFSFSEGLKKTFKHFENKLK
ncbi:MAG: dTDP-glucose 4,6-dehydratase [Parcubacteria group bacterium]|nr:dTDP-glucose 4,6-dehydratase [Parcubacteria group bacterium]